MTRRKVAEERTVLCNIVMYGWSCMYTDHSLGMIMIGNAGFDNVLDIFDNTNDYTTDCFFSWLVGTV